MLRRSPILPLSLALILGPASAGWPAGGMQPIQGEAPAGEAAPADEVGQGATPVEPAGDAAVPVDQPLPALPLLPGAEAAAGTREEAAGGPSDAAEAAPDAGGDVPAEGEAAGENEEEAVVEGSPLIELDPEAPAPFEQSGVLDDTPSTFHGITGRLWRLQLPENGVLTVQTENSSFDTVLRLYRRDGQGTWKETDMNDDAGGSTHSSLQIESDGDEVLVQLSSLGNEVGSAMRWKLVIRQLQEIKGHDHWGEALDIGPRTEAVWAGTNAQLEVDEFEADWGGNSKGGRGVWWRFTAPADGDVVIDSTGSNFDTILQAARAADDEGKPGDETLFDDDGAGSLCSKLAIPVKAGERWLFMLDGLGDGGNFQFNFRFFEGGRPRAANDSVATAIPFGAMMPALLVGDNEAAEAGNEERNLGAQPNGHGLWWSFSPTRSGLLALDLSETRFQVMLHLFEKRPGNAQLQRIQTIYPGMQRAEASGFGVRAGGEYLILVESQNGGTGEVRVQADLFEGVAPLNDNFDQALNLGRSEHVEIGASLAHSSIEPNEQQYTNPPNSVWYRWTAPRDGWVRVRTTLPAGVDNRGGGMAAQMFIARGDRLDSLSEVMWDMNSYQALMELSQDLPWMNESALFEAKRGETYNIQLQANLGAVPGGQMQLSLDMLEGDLLIPNDSIAQAIHIGRLPYQVQLSPQMASVEGWERGQWPAVQRSLWWSYTAPEDQTLEVELQDFRREGSGLLALARMDEDGQPRVFENLSGANGNSGFWFGQVKAGETIHIGAGSGASRTTLLSLQVSVLAPTSLPAHDAFARAADLGAEEKAEEDFQLRYASLEPGEAQLVGQNSDPVRLGSLWYRWTAPRDGVLRVSGMSLGGNQLGLFRLPEVEPLAPAPLPDAAHGGARLGAARGIGEPPVDPAGAPAMEDLEMIASGNLQPQMWGGAEAQRLVSKVVAGRSYWVRVATNPETAGQFNGFNQRLMGSGKVELALLPAPDGDSSARPLTIPAALPAEVKFELEAATLEPWEVEAGLEGNGSVWLSTTAAADAWVSLASASGLRVELFDPQSDGTLQKREVSLALAEDQPLTLKVGPGRKTLVRLSDFNSVSYGFVSGEPEEVELKLDAGAVAVVPAHDNLADARRVGALPYQDECNLALATAEPFEDDGSASVWYRLAPTADGRLSIDTAGSDFDTYVELFPAGIEPDQLSARRLGANDDDNRDSSGTTSYLEYDARAGEELLLRVRNYDSPAPSAGPVAAEDFVVSRTSVALKLKIEGPAAAAGPATPPEQAGAAEGDLPAANEAHEGGEGEAGAGTPPEEDGDPADARQGEADDDLPPGLIIR